MQSLKKDASFAELGYMLSVTTGLYPVLLLFSISGLKRLNNMTNKIQQ